MTITEQLRAEQMEVSRLEGWIASLPCHDEWISSAHKKLKEAIKFYDIALHFQGTPYPVKATITCRQDVLPTSQASERKRNLLALYPGKAVGTYISIIIKELLKTLSLLEANLVCDTCSETRQRHHVHHNLSLAIADLSLYLNESYL